MLLHGNPRNYPGLATTRKLSGLGLSLGKLQRSLVNVRFQRFRMILGNAAVGAADRALYAAKESGRDRLVMSGQVVAWLQAGHRRFGWRDQPPRPWHSIR
jgi:hypothetical protein